MPLNDSSTLYSLLDQHNSALKVLLNQQNSNNNTIESLSSNTTNNSDITSLSNEVGSKANQSNVNNSFSSVNTSLATLNRNKDDLQNQVTQNKQNINNANTSITSLNGNTEAKNSASSAHNSLSSQINSLNYANNELNTAIGPNAGSQISSLASQVNNFDNTTQKSLDGRINSNTTDIQSLSNSVTSNSNAISSLSNNTVDSFTAGKIANNDMLWLKSQVPNNSSLSSVVSSAQMYTDAKVANIHPQSAPNPYIPKVSNNNDVNQFTTPGCYTIPADILLSGLTNGPSMSTRPSYIVIEVFLLPAFDSSSSDDCVLQRITGNTGAVYVRTGMQDGSGWASWGEI